MMCLLARQLYLNPLLLARFDESDLVQETMLRAHANLVQFRGTTEAELIAWLQRILANVFRDKLSEAHADKRDVDLEQSLEQSSARLETFLAGDQSSPSQQAERKEMLIRLAEALEELPEDQRDVFIQRDLLGVKVGEIAERLKKTEKSVAGLLLRARRTLRDALENFQ